MFIKAFETCVLLPLSARGKYKEYIAVIFEMVHIQ